MFAPPRRSSPPPRRQRFPSPPPRGSSSPPRRQRFPSPPPRGSSPPPRSSSSPQPLSGQNPRSLSSDTGFNPRSLHSDTGFNPRSFTRSAYTGENLRNPNNPVLDMELGETLRSIEERGYNTPTYYGSPLNSPRETIQATRSLPSETPRGGKYSKNVYKKVGKKEVLGKDRVIYKMKGSNKEYLKSKGMYIPISEYKKLKK